ncbi:MAG: M20 family metallopeptidase [Spirochaetales bacterium]|jgi:amidohydrolase
MVDISAKPIDIDADNLRRFFEGLAGRIRSHRRALHEIPELGFAEIETSAYIRKELDALGVAYTAGIGGTGIVARIGGTGSARLAGGGLVGGASTGEAKGKSALSGRKVAIRADMDALPIQEEGEKSYTSTHAGKMHACGHDAHTAMLLGVAEYFKSVEGSLDGEILLIFQPAEERSDGKGLTGARHIIGSGLLNGVSAVLGAHVTTDAPAGTFGIIAGPVTASGDMFRATIHGRGGHDAFANRTIDPIFLATQVLNNIYAIRSRKIGPMECGTLSVGTIESGTTANVIPERALITGTIRTFDAAVRDVFVAELERALKIAETLGGRYELEIPVHVPETRNDAGLAATARKVAVDFFGEGCLFPMKPIMGVEDFSWYSGLYPALFVMLGATLSDGIERPVHNPSFDIDDGILYRGSALLALTALRILAGSKVAEDTAGGR